VNKVKVGGTYRYTPVLIDKIRQPYNIQEGDVVQVVNLPGCPHANVMGHCHVQHLDGRFAGLVCCNSLREVPTYEQLKAAVAKLEGK
jgi:hypothetical protein